MATKKKPVQEVQTSETPYEARVITIDSVVDWQLVKLEGYLTDEPLNETSKLIRHQDDGEVAVNKYFTKK